MTALIELVMALAGPDILKWFAGAGAALGGLLALIAAQRRGRVQGRAEVEAENARARARRQAELAEVRGRQARAAANRPEEEELDAILQEGKF